MCSCGDGEPPRVYAERYRKARKPLACSECTRIVQRGSWYVDIQGLWGDSWDNFRQCLNCHARYAAWQKVECGAIMTQLHESIVECLVQRSSGFISATREYWRRRTIDRETGRAYLAAKRASRARIDVEVNDAAAAQQKRYSAAAVAREAAKRLRAVPVRVT